MDPRLENAPNDVPLKRDHDSVDDFEHLGHDSSPDDRSLEHQQQQQQQARLIDAPRVDDLLHIGDSFQESVLPSALIADADEVGRKPMPATPPPSADFDKTEAMAQSSGLFQRSLERGDPKVTSMAFVKAERFYNPTSMAAQFGRENNDNDDDDDDAGYNDRDDGIGLQPPLLPVTSASTAVNNDNVPLASSAGARTHDGEKKRAEVEAQPIGEYVDDVVAGLGIGQGRKRFEDETTARPISVDDFAWNVKSSAKETSPSPVDLLGSAGLSLREDQSSISKNIMDDDSWNVVERTDVKTREHVEPPTKPLPPLPKEAESESAHPSEPMLADTAKDVPSQRNPEHGTTVKRRQETKLRESDYVGQPGSSRPAGNKDEIEIAPKEIFRDMGLDAWFNPERLNPKVAGLIYWRDPKKSGIVFGTTLGVLLSLAYFSLISVLAYLSLLVLSGTVLFRIYKTVLQAVQKTSDGHPFKDILDLDLTLPAEKVHEVADVAVAHANAAVSELRRLFLVEDFVDSLKFGVLLWCLTYVGSWFNGMTLIIIGVVALFTLPKVYETNQEQIDQNLALVQAKINEITAKVKAAIPLGKRTEPTKEE